MNIGGLSSESDRAVNNIIKMYEGTYGISGYHEDRKEDQSVESLHLDANWNLTDKKIQIIWFVTGVGSSHRSGRDKIDRDGDNDF